MGITIAKKPELDINGTRWVEFAPGAKILVASFASPLYKSSKAIVQRHLQAIDAQAKAGTKEFNLEAIQDVELETADDLFFELAARHLIKDWEGVDVAELPGQPAKYTPELCVQLMEQMPDVYWLAIRTALDIATRAEKRAEETAKKPSTPTSGGEIGQENPAKKSAGSESA